MCDVADRPALVTDKIEITLEMMEAGEIDLLEELGGAVNVFWKPRDLAASVYRAMIAEKARI